MSHGHRSGPRPTEPTIPTMQDVAEPSNAGATSSTQISSSESSERINPEQEQLSEQAITPSEDQRVRILGKLEHTMESFRNGKIAKTVAISSILRTLGENSDVAITQSQKEATFDSYLTEILSIQSTFDDPPGNDVIGPDPTCGPSSTKPGKPLRASKRNHEATESDSEDEEGGQSKKQKLVESDMPWFVGESLQSTKAPALTIATPVPRKPVGYCEPTIETYPKLSSLSKSPQTHQPESLLLNGNASSKGRPSTSTKSSHRSTMLSLMKRERVAWEIQKSLLASLKLGKRCPQPRNGRQRGDEPPEQYPSHSLTEKKNSLSMGTTSSRNLQQRFHHHTTNSFSTTLPCEMKLQQGNASCSQTTTDFPDYIQQSSYQTALKALPVTQAKNQGIRHKPTPNQKFATNIMLEHARTPIANASIDTSAKTVENLDTSRKIARSGPSEIFGLQPKYLRHNLWEEGSSLSPTTAEWSERACPLPRPPAAVVSDPILSKTISDNSDLFQVNTPINVDVFESLLQRHPNPAFVSSVCTGLREGFWPWAA